MSAARILIVDDDPGIVEVLGDRLAAQGHRIEKASDGQEAMVLLRADPPDLVLLDLQMPRMDGMQVLERISEEQIDTTAVVLTAVGTVERAVAAMKSGAYDFLTKPFDPQHVTLIVEKALEREGLRRRNRFLVSELQGRGERIIGESRGIAAVIDTARRAAASRSTILILGESGTGKEVLARSIHLWSDRRDDAFVAVNCVALSEELLESELFGHEKGSFTGALRQKQGKFEIADGGTLFLDEIAELKEDLQAKLLRVLQEHRFERVGGTRSIEVDIRIIAATNRDLELEMSRGGFRDDLFYRLNVITLTMPPLRERKEDIPPLRDHFLRIFASETKRSVRGFSPEATAYLERYDWPGNVRELRNTIERAVVLGQDDLIMPHDLPAVILEYEVDGGEPDASFHGQVRHLKAGLIRDALRRAGGRQRKAAELLGLNPTYLSRLIRNLGIKEP